MLDPAAPQSRERLVREAVRVDAPARSLRIALAHDWLVTRRGGELVLDAIVRALAPEHEVERLYTLVDAGQAITPAIDALARVCSPIQRLPGGRGALRRWLLPAYPIGVRALARRIAKDHARHPYDLLISTSSCAVKNLPPPAGVPHLCYCHAPARYLWQLQDEYARGSLLRALGLRACSPMLCRWDRRGTDHATRLLANSRHTARMIEQIYGREAGVLHPPVRTGFFTPDPGMQRKDFWLVVSALEPYKRVDLAIEATRIAGVRLVIIGRGSQEHTLRRMAHAGVAFRTDASDDDLRDLYRTARALLFPQVEDFGIACVEAQACGCPVLARRAGGALDTVIEGRTGAFFDDPDPRAIARAMRSLGTFDPDDLRTNALRFGEAQFTQGLLDEITRVVR